MLFKTQQAHTLRRARTRPLRCFGSLLAARRGPAVALWHGMRVTPSEPTAGAFKAWPNIWNIKAARELSGAYASAPDEAERTATKPRRCRVAERFAGVKCGCGRRPRKTNFEHGVRVLLLQQSLNDSQGRGWQSGVGFGGSCPAPTPCREREELFTR